MIETFPIKIKYKGSMSPSNTPSQNCTGSYSYCSKTSKGNKRYTDWEDRITTLFAYR